MSPVTVVARDRVDRIDLPGGSWSRMVITGATSAGASASLGYSVFTPGTELPPVRHETEELAYVVSGRGELRLDGEVTRFGPDDALHIPAEVWHAVVNTGDEDVVMIFGFPHPDYPPTERR